MRGSPARENDVNDRDAHSIPTHGQVVAELSVLRSRGIGRIRGMELKVLNDVCDRLKLTYADDVALSVAGLLRRAVDSMGESDDQVSVEFLFGLAPGTALWGSGQRIKRAAEIHGVSAERFRKEPMSRLINVVADSVLGLLLNVETSPVRLSVSSEHLRGARRAALDQAEDAIDRAIRETTPIHRERMLLEVSAILGGDNSADSRTLLARALKEIADIRRDRGVLTGPSGAFRLYANSGHLISDRHESRLQTELVLMRASCLEMSGLDSAARAEFARAEETASAGMNWYRSWARLRQATTSIKLGDTDSAVTLLDASEALSDNLGPSWRAQILMKRASLSIAKEMPTAAVASADQAIRLVKFPSMISSVRMKLQLAHALHFDGEQSAAISLIEEAYALADLGNFAHQLEHSRKLAMKVDPDLSASLHSQSVLRFLPLSKDDIIEFERNV